jgi:hypothetical protein
MKKTMPSVVVALALLLGVARSASAVYDGVPSTGSFTVVTVSALAKAKATGSLVVVSTTAALKSRVTVGTALMTEGIDWRVGTSTVTAAVSLKNAINAKQAQAEATFATGDATIALEALDYGTLYNSVSLKSSAQAAVSTSANTMTGGLDDAIITINKVQLIQGRDWFVQDVATNTAINLAAVNNNPILKNQVEAVALGAQVYLRAISSPVAYPLATSAGAALTVSQALMSGGSVGNLARSICNLGSVNSLPTSDFPAGCHLTLISDGKDYLSTETVTNSGSWLSNTLVNGSVDTGKLASDSVTTAKILNGAVNTAKLANDAVTTSAILTGAVNTGKLAEDSVVASKVMDGAIETNKLHNDAVTVGKIADASVDTFKVKDDSVTTAKVLTGAINTGKLGADSVTTAKILDLNVTGAKIAAATIDTSKISTSVADSGKIMTSCGGVADWRTGGLCP